MATPPGRVLVTGAGGFVGGHVARALASSGVEVRGLTRRPPAVEPGDPPIEWVAGDLRDPDTRRHAVAGARGVVHAAGWVSLGRDRDGQARAINVDATRALLDEAEAAGVERFVYTSTLWTAAAGTPERPADEDSPWDLEAIRGPYCDTKREAERIVLGRERDGFRTVVLCPGLVIGPRDVRPTSTRLLLEMARARLIALLPEGGIPVVDAAVVARAHRAALTTARTGRRYLLAGPYLSYPEMARLVAAVAGRPRRILVLPPALRGPIAAAADLAGRLGLDRTGDLSAAAVRGGFLRLHASGARADAEFGLVHPPPIRSIREALDDHRRSGRAPWLDLRPPPP